MFMYVCMYVCTYVAVVTIEPALALADLLRSQVDYVVLVDLRDRGQAAGRTYACMYV